MSEEFRLDQDPNHPPGWLTLKEGWWLQEHAKRTDKGSILEIGSLCGRSASFILDGLKDKFGGPEAAYMLWCIDPWQDFNPLVVDSVGLPPMIFWEYMQKNEHLGHFKMLQCTSAEAAPIIVQRQYGFAFIDGAHKAPWPIHDLIMCAQVTNIIFLHDYYMNAPNYVELYDYDVRDAVNYWVASTKWNIVDVVESTVKLEGPLIHGAKLDMIDR